MYIEQTDLEEGMFPEVLKVVSRKPENIITAITEAMSEVASYLNARYKITDEYNRTGDQRNILVKKFVREIAIYNCYNISNPANMPESRENRYKSIISSLKDIQAERATIEGLDRLDSTTGTGSNYLRFGGNTKRNNSY
jgi:phage gp36-like protein